MGESIEVRPDEWLRTYATVSRTGCVSATMAACEEEWGTRYFGNPAAVEKARKSPCYAAYAHALRSTLQLPVPAYRICRYAAYQRWRHRPFSTPTAVTLSLCVAEAFLQLHRHRRPVLLQVCVRDPEAVLLRGRPRGYELVIDPSRIAPEDVVPLKSASEQPGPERPGAWGSA